MASTAANALARIRYTPGTANAAAQNIQRIMEERGVSMEEAKRAYQLQAMLMRGNEGGISTGELQGSGYAGGGTGGQNNVADIKSVSGYQPPRGGGGGSAYNKGISDLQTVIATLMGTGRAGTGNALAALLHGQRGGAAGKERQDLALSLGFGSGDSRSGIAKPRVGVAERRGSGVGGAGPSKFAPQGKRIGRDRYQENIQAEMRERMRNEELERERQMSQIRAQELEQKLKLVRDLFNGGGGSGGSAGGGATTRDTTNTEQLVNVAGRPELRNTTMTEDKDRTIDIINAITRAL